MSSKAAAFEVSVEAGNHGSAGWLDDDGRPRRTGTVWTASAHIITAVIGSGVLSLAWAIAQLGWAAGPAVMLLFAFVIYYTSTLLAECYRSGDPVAGKRNYTYMDAVRSSLDGAKVKLCGVIQYANLFGVAIGYTIAASISMQAIRRADCFHEKGHKNPCRSSSNPYMILFGVAEVVFSQIPDFDQIWWLSFVAAVMSFTYSAIGLALGVITTTRTPLWLRTACNGTPERCRHFPLTTHIGVKRFAATPEKNQEPTSLSPPALNPSLPFRFLFLKSSPRLPHLHSPSPICSPTSAAAEQIELKGALPRNLGLCCGYRNCAFSRPSRRRP